MLVHPDKSRKHRVSTQVQLARACRNRNRRCRPDCGDLPVGDNHSLIRPLGSARSIDDANVQQRYCLLAKCSEWFNAGLQPVLCAGTYCHKQCNRAVSQGGSDSIEPPRELRRGVPVGFARRFVLLLSPVLASFLVASAPLVFGHHLLVNRNLLCGQH